MMGCYWITASFFLILPFYFFKSPTYCQNPQDAESVCGCKRWLTKNAEINALKPYVVTL